MSVQREAVVAFLTKHWEAKASHEILNDPAIQSFEAAVERLKMHQRAIDIYLKSLPPKELQAVALKAMREADEKRPFNAFGTDADFEHYGRCTFLTIHEAIALSLGKNPRVVTEDVIRPFIGTSIFAEEFANRLDLLERSVICGEMPEHFSPLQFLTWAHERKIAVPDEFIRCTFARGEPIRYWHNLCLELAHELDAVTKERDEAVARFESLHDQYLQRTFEDWEATNAGLEQAQQLHLDEVAALKAALVKAETEISELRSEAVCPIPAAPDNIALPSSDLAPLERKSTLTMIAAMAVDGYRYNPNDAKSSTPQEVVSAAQLVGLDLSDDTARKYLREACKLKGFARPDKLYRKPKAASRKPKAV